MKKKIVVIALGAFALVGTALYLNAQISKPTLNDAGGFIIRKCMSCNGTGWRGNMACPMCNGTGRQSSY